MTHNSALELLSFKPQFNKKSSTLLNIFLLSVMMLPGVLIIGGYDHWMEYKENSHKMDIYQKMESQYRFVLYINKHPIAPDSELQKVLYQKNLKISGDQHLNYVMEQAIPFQKMEDAQEMLNFLNQHHVSYQIKFNGYVNNNQVLRAIVF